MRQSFRLSVIAAAVILSIPAARAQLVDDVTVTAKGDNAVVNIRLNAQVQYLRHAPVGQGTLFQIDFQLLAAANEFRPSPVEEFRKLGPSQIAPGVSVEYPPQGTTLVKRLMVRFTKPVKIKVLPGEGNRGFRILLPMEKAAVAPRKKGPPETAVAASVLRYAIILDSVPGERIEQTTPIPAQLQDYFVFTTTTTRDGQTVSQLNLGYFATEAEARKAQQLASRNFPNARVASLEEFARPPAAATPEAPAAPPGKEEPPKAAAPVVAEPTPAIQSPEELEKHAADLLAKGRAAVEAKQYDAAIDALNRLLILPPNRSSQEAQELVGLARQQNGELRKAKAEYELYLKLYPEGEGAKRVRERIATLGTEQEMAAAERARPPEEEKPGVFTTSGSFSTFYYRGASRAETQVVSPTTVDKAVFSGVDQSSLVTNLDVTGRYRTNEWDNRIVVRDTYLLDFLKRPDDRRLNQNRLTAAYYDFKNLQHNFNGRLGRQTGTSGGVLGRFDGATLGYGFSPQWRLNVVAGKPVQEPSIDSSQRFIGLNVDLSTFLDRWSGNAFFINQTVDGIVDRRAVGGELRYFDPQRTAYALVDYDVVYKALNIGMLQGTWSTDAGYTFNMLADYRKIPSLQTVNALIGEPTTSVRSLLATMSEQQLREQAKAKTATAKQLYVGVTKPVSQTWQLGTDFHVSNIGALPATVSSTGVPIPASPATGTVYNVNVQAIGTNLMTQRDVTVFSAGYITGRDYKGRTLGLNNLTAVGDKWTVEPSLRLYWQRDVQQNNLRRIVPGLRVSYKWRERETLEFEALLEKTNVTGPTQNDSTLRRFFSVGYRIDF